MSTPQRPKITKEMITVAAQEFGKRHGWSEQEIADIVLCFQPPFMDGYDLAKELGCRCLWDIDAAIVDDLDGLGMNVSALLRKACIDWARDNDIQPPFPVGTTISRGEITGIYQHDGACYEVRAPGETEPSRRYIVRFEEACLPPGSKALEAAG